MRRLRQPGTVRTLAKRALLCLLLGAVLQYLVAVGFGLDEHLPGDSQMWTAKLYDGEHFAGVDVETWCGIGREVWTAYLLVGELEWAGQQDFGDAEWRQIRPDAIRDPSAKPRVPSWSRFPDMSKSWRLGDLPAHPFDDAFGVGCGWPWRSASFLGVDSDQGGNMAVDGGMVIEQVPFIPHDSFPRVIPLQIIWPGAIANTLLYGAALFVPFALIPITRQHLRRRAGRCIACGYDLRGAAHPVCPECGAAHDRAHRSSP